MCLKNFVHDQIAACGCTERQRGQIFNGNRFLIADVGEEFGIFRENGAYIFLSLE